MGSTLYLFSVGLSAALCLGQTNQSLPTGSSAGLSVASRRQQDLVVSGKVTDEKGEALPGVSIVVKGTTRGTKSDVQGLYQLAVPNAGAVLVFSFVGYMAKEMTVGTGLTLNVALDVDSRALNEVIVTGVFDKRRRMEASVGITTLSSNQIQRLQPNSAADLLKNVPGVYVNSSQGEIRNTVYSRGVGAGTSGYFYVSMQEDGLPVTNVSGTSWGPTTFCGPTLRSTVWRPFGEVRRPLPALTRLAASSTMSPKQAGPSWQEKCGRNSAWKVVPIHTIVPICRWVVS